MDEQLINNWNGIVGHSDVVYHLGDFCLSDLSYGQSVFNRLNGQKNLIAGNHDKTSRQIKGWGFIKDYYEFYVGKQFIVLSHYAMRVWNKSHHGAWMLWGHSHGSLSDDPNALSFDVGVDCHDYRPLSYDDVARVMTKKTWKPVDHHGK